MTTRKVALITGSGTGIGAATALLLAKRNYDVVIHYSKSRPEAELSQQFCEATGANTLLLHGDVKDDGSCNAMVEATIERWGKIDTLVNNAGITVFTGIDNWDALNADMFHEIYAVNSLGAFQMARACRPYLKETLGSIVNVSSAAGQLGRGSSVPYIMSKGALDSLTRYLARALAPEIRVNSVCPGLVTSRWFRNGIGEEEYEKLVTKFNREALLGKPNTPEEVAEAIVFLIEGGKTITGELLLLDSGLHLG